MNMQNPEKQPATPKVVFLGASCDHKVAGMGNLKADEIDLQARIISMGRLHHAFTATGAIALAASAAVPGTTVNQLIGREITDGKVTFGHRSGKMKLQVNVENTSKDKK